MISIPCNARNPAEYYACIGLLEWADIVERGAMGCFDAQSFSLMGIRSSLQALLQGLVHAEIRAVDPTNLEGAIYYGESLILNWWEQDRHPMKGWSGGGNYPSLFLPRFQKAALSQVGTPDPLGEYIFSNRGMITMDARVRSGSSETGFSADDMSSKPHRSQYALTLLLAFIGLQRTLHIEKRYCTWRSLVPPMLVPAASLGHLPGYTRDTYGFDTFRVKANSGSTVGYAHIIEEDGYAQI